MRFNDLLRTVLAHGGEGTAAAVTRWRQCIDLVAQYDVSGARTAHSLTEEEAEAVFEVLERAQANSSGRSSASHPSSSLAAACGQGRLCRFLAQDHPAVVASVMARARLTDDDWASIIPVVGPLARSILRRRADLGPLAHTALARFGPSDLALPSAPNTPRKLSPANDMPGRARLAESAAPIRRDERHPQDCRAESSVSRRRGRHPEPRGSGSSDPRSPPSTRSWQRPEKRGRCLQLRDR